MTTMGEKSILTSCSDDTASARHHWGYYLWYDLGCYFGHDWNSHLGATYGATFLSTLHHTLPPVFIGVSSV